MDTADTNIFFIDLTELTPQGIKTQDVKDGIEGIALSP